MIWPVSLIYKPRDFLKRSTIFSTLETTIISSEIQQNIHKEGIDAQDNLKQPSYNWIVGDNKNKYHIFFLFLVKIVFVILSFISLIQLNLIR